MRFPSRVKPLIIKVHKESRRAENADFAGPSLHLLTFWLRASLKGHGDANMTLSIVAAMVLLWTPLGQNQPAANQHDHDMSHRGDQGMGFAQDKTTHHFLLQKDGGAIQVTADSADDQASVSQIRMHLRHITRAFQSGDCNIP